MNYNEAVCFIYNIKFWPSQIFVDHLKMCCLFLILDIAHKKSFTAVK